MNKKMTDKLTLDELVENLERHEAERELESLRSGSPFDAGVVEGISNAIDRLDSARSSSDLNSVVQDLVSTVNGLDQEEGDDAYAQGIVAGASHVAELVREELADTPEQDF